jgi:hypothetical protein
MSALDRCWQSEVNSSYCERRVVIGGGGAFSSACRRDCSLVCRLVAILATGLGLDVIAGEWVV